MEKAVCLAVFVTLVVLIIICLTQNFYLMNFCLIKILIILMVCLQRKYFKIKIVTRVRFYADTGRLRINIEGFEAPRNWMDAFDKTLDQELPAKVIKQTPTKYK